MSIVFLQLSAMGFWIIHNKSSAARIFSFAFTSGTVVPVAKSMVSSANMVMQDDRKKGRSFMKIIRKSGLRCCLAEFSAETGSELDGVSLKLVFGSGQKGKR